MQKYRCNKVVGAFLIGKIEGTVLFSHDESFSLDVGADYISQHPLNTPGYCVEHEYHRSWSPKDVFEREHSLENGALIDLTKGPAAKIVAELTDYNNLLYLHVAYLEPKRTVTLLKMRREQFIKLMNWHKWM